MLEMLLADLSPLLLSCTAEARRYGLVQLVRPPGWPGRPAALACLAGVCLVVYSSLQ